MLKYSWEVSVSDNPCSSSSEDDEYSDPLEVAASVGARLSTLEKASISWKRKVQTNPAEKKSQYDIIMYIMSMQSEIYFLNLYLSCQSISYAKKLKATFGFWGNF